MKETKATKANAYPFPQDVVMSTFLRRQEGVLENIRQHNILLWRLDRKSANDMLIDKHAV